MSSVIPKTSASEPASASRRSLAERVFREHRTVRHTAGIFTISKDEVKLAKAVRKAMYRDAHLTKHTLAGLGIGAGAGGLVGAGIETAANRYDRVEGAAAGGAIGAGIGGLLGAAIRAQLAGNKARRNISTLINPDTGKPFTPEDIDALRKMDNIDAAGLGIMFGPLGYAASLTQTNV